MDKINVVLIGMPSSGKSTIGDKLAEKLNLKFIDTDLVIRQRENMALRDIINKHGLQNFLEKQEAAILDLDIENHIIATGGSVVYGDASMQHLKRMGAVIYLRLEYSEIEQRVAPDRRFARESGKSLQDLYVERTPLYEKYADITIQCSNKSVEQIVTEIKDRLGR